MTERYDFLKVKFTKMLRFFSVVEVHGLIYRRPLGQNSSFASSYLKYSLDSVASCGASCLVNSTAFFLYVMHLLIFSKRVRGELPFQRGAIIMAIRQTSFKGGKILNVSLAPTSPRKNFSHSHTGTNSRKAYPQGGTSILGGRGAWPQNLPLKFLLEP